MEEGVKKLVEKVSSMESVVDGVHTIITQLKTDLEAAKDDPVALQAAIDKLDEYARKLGQAVAVNTGADPNNGPDQEPQPLPPVEEIASDAPATPTQDPRVDEVITADTQPAVDPNAPTS